MAAGSAAAGLHDGTEQHAEQVNVTHYHWRLSVVGCGATLWRKLFVAPDLLAYAHIPQGLQEPLAKLR